MPIGRKRAHERLQPDSSPRQGRRRLVLGAVRRRGLRRRLRRPCGRLLRREPARRRHALRARLRDGERPPLPLRLRGRRPGGRSRRAARAVLAEARRMGGRRRARRPLRRVLADVLRELPRDGRRRGLHDPLRLPDPDGAHHGRLLPRAADGADARRDRPGACGHLLPLARRRRAPRRRVRRVAGRRLGPHLRGLHRRRQPGSDDPAGLGDDVLGARLLRPRPCRLVGGDGRRGGVPPARRRRGLARGALPRRRSDAPLARLHGLQLAAARRDAHGHPRGPRAADRRRDRRPRLPRGVHAPPRRRAPARPLRRHPRPGASARAAALQAAVDVRRVSGQRRSRLSPS